MQELNKSAFNNNSPSTTFMTHRYYPKETLKMKKMNILSIAIVIVTTIFSFSSCAFIEATNQTSTPQDKYELMREAETLKKQGDGSMNQENYEEAIEYYTEAIGLYIDALSMPAQLYSSAYIQDRTGERGGTSDYQINQRILERDRATDNDIHNILPALYLARGTCYYMLEDFNEALEDYDKVVSSLPTFGYVYKLRSLIYIEKEEYGKAFVEINKALKYTPDDAGAFFIRANVYRRMGNYDDAMADYTSAITFDSSSKTYYYHRGSLYAHHFEDYNKAIADFNVAITLDPNMADAYYKRGNAYENIGNLEQAQKDWDKALALDPNIADSL
jgi:tetratricopeptide (TPR) repeat protein